MPDSSEAQRAQLGDCRGSFDGYLNDLDYAPFTEHGGTDGHLNDLGTQAADILTNLTETLAA